MDDAQEVAGTFASVAKNRFGPANDFPTNDGRRTAGDCQRGARLAAADRWSIKEVIGHLIDSAASNYQRFVRAQFATELNFPKYEQNEWVSCQQYQCSSRRDLLELWEHYNRHLAHVIRHVPDLKLSAPCRISPYEPVTLMFLIEDYVVHLRHHLQKIAERVNLAS